MELFSPFQASRMKIKNSAFFFFLQQNRDLIFFHQKWNKNHLNLIYESRRIFTFFFFSLFIGSTIAE